MTDQLEGLAGDIGFKLRSARAVARQIEEVLPEPYPHQYEQVNEACYLLATVIDLLDVASTCSETLEARLKAASLQAASLQAA